MEIIIRDTALLFLLGICGWGVFSMLRIPVAPVLGTLTLIGALRIAGYPLPPAPGYIFMAVQVMLGYFAGTKITRETVKELKSMAVPAAIIVAWALSLVFLLGGFLSLVSSLDLYTSILSSSIGGLPEMTIIALASGADVTVIVIMQSFRMVATILVFPFIVHRWLGEGQKDLAAPVKEEAREMLALRYLPWVSLPFSRAGASVKKGLTALRQNPRELKHQVGWLLMVLTAAAAGGSLLQHLGVPAGGMIGAMFTVAALSLAGVPVKPLPGGTFNYMLVGVGIMVSGSLSPDTLEVLSGGGLLAPVLVATLVPFMTAMGVSYLIHKLVGWDYPTCFLAAAPGGFTVMTTLAIKYGRDPFRVSLLHLCRLVALKTFVPLVFMFLI